MHRFRTTFHCKRYIRMNHKYSSVAVQLDYFMSTQFCGIAVANAKGLYKQVGIKLEILPYCPVGHEPRRVREKFEFSDRKQLCVGTIEQNVLLPVLGEANGRILDVRAIATMFSNSPLCLAALRTFEPQQRIVIGAHEDTVELLSTLNPKAMIIPVSREEKITMLKDGRIDALQVYDVMEVLTLKRQLGQSLHVLPFQIHPSHRPANFGYAQVLFTPSESLIDPLHRSLLEKFLKATFAGWSDSIRDPNGAAHIVRQAIREQFPTEQPDHWIDSHDFTEESINLCCNYVKSTACGGKLGVIDQKKWRDSSAWLIDNLPSCRHLKDCDPAQRAAFIDSTFDTSIWSVDERIMQGDVLARKISETTRQRAQQALAVLGRRPSLAVITVGDAPVGSTSKDASRRLQLYGTPTASWFSKTDSGDHVGVDVTELNLPHESSTADVMSVLRGLGHTDGIQLMWPLPAHVNAEMLYNAIPVRQDVDGAHFLGRSELSGGHSVSSLIAPHTVPECPIRAPVTPAAVLRLLSEYKIPLAGRHVVIVGRSRTVGQPLAYMCTAQHALVTIAHSEISPDALEKACSTADLLIPCTGEPGLIQPHWIKPGAVVVNVGAAFINNELQPDVAGGSDVGKSGLHAVSSLAHIHRVSPCPGGVGPLSLALLLEAVVDTAMASATNHSKLPGADSSTPEVGRAELESFLVSNTAWKLVPKASGEASSGLVSSLTADFAFPSYTAAIDFLVAVERAADKINHHPNVTLTHACTEGAAVKLELFTFSTKSVTEWDLRAAVEFEGLHRSGATKRKTETGWRSIGTRAIHIPPIRMADYNYILPDEKIARRPAHPRGSSKLLVAHHPSNSPAESEITPALSEDRNKSDTALSEGELMDSSFGNLWQHLPRRAHLVFNESLVFSARVFTQPYHGIINDTVHTSRIKQQRQQLMPESVSVTAAVSPHHPIEILFLSPEQPSADPSLSLRSPVHGQTWRCMVRKNFTEPGAVLQFVTPFTATQRNSGEGEAAAGMESSCVNFLARVVHIHGPWLEDDEDDGIEASVTLIDPRHTTQTHSAQASSESEFQPQIPLSLLALLTSCGEIPIPPYLRRECEDADTESYQNVFASALTAGSVAAPTAGLHFTAPLIEQLYDIGMSSSTLALHVSAATFKPVTAAMVGDHQMHKEQFELNVSQLVAVTAALKEGRPIVPVGTTSTRLLETLYWLGVKELNSQGKGSLSRQELLELEQWEAYELLASNGGKLPCTALEALEALHRRHTAGGWDSRLRGSTALCIVPGYTFAVASGGIITNFHQPDSTLLLLVGAFFEDSTGQRLAALYQHALERDYRFLSYGDACLLLREKPVQ